MSYYFIAIAKLQTKATAERDRANRSTRFNICNEKRPNIVKLIISKLQRWHHFFSDFYRKVYFSCNVCAICNVVDIQRKAILQTLEKYYKYYMKPTFLTVRSPKRVKI